MGNDSGLVQVTIEVLTVLEGRSEVVDNIRQLGTGETIPPIPKNYYRQEWRTVKNSIENVGWSFAGTKQEEGYENVYTYTAWVRPNPLRP